jgi:hypothetical protein
MRLKGTIASGIEQLRIIKKKLAPFLPRTLALPDRDASVPEGQVTVFSCRP